MLKEEEPSKENSFSSRTSCLLLEVANAAQISEFKFLEDRKRRLVSQLLQRKCISTALQIPWSQIRIRKTKGKKPWVLCDGVDKDAAPNFNFNVSHEVCHSSGVLPCFTHIDIESLSSNSHMYRHYAAISQWSDRLQGEYVALASEPVSICGVDVSAPQQFRGQRRSTLDEMLSNIGSVFTANEVPCLG